MGAILSEPVTTKASATGASRRHAYAVSAMQGWRDSMEDDHTCELDLTADGSNDYALFAVFDGHGGSSVARCSSRMLPKTILAQPGFAAGNFEDAMRTAYLSLDVALRSQREVEAEPCGCTAVSALITPDKIVVANAGDSRAVLSTNATVVPLSFDHKPFLPAEQLRIEKAGGFVSCGRVNGNLALSRAFGDYEFKCRPSLPAEEQIVTANPEIVVHSITNDDEFLVVACDGIWDCVTNEKCVAYIRYRLAEGAQLLAACHSLMDLCLAPSSSTDTGLGCDNMTITIVALLGDRSQDEWYTYMREKYADMLRERAPIESRRVSTDTELDAPMSAESGPAAAMSGSGSGSLPGSASSSGVNSSASSSAAALSLQSLFLQHLSGNSAASSAETRALLQQITRAKKPAPRSDAPNVTIEYGDEHLDGMEDTDDNDDDDDDDDDEEIDDDDDDDDDDLVDKIDNSDNEAASASVSGATDDVTQVLSDRDEHSDSADSDATSSAAGSEKSKRNLEQRGGAGDGKKQKQTKKKNRDTPQQSQSESAGLPSSQSQSSELGLLPSSSSSTNASDCSIASTDSRIDSEAGPESAA